MSTYSQAMSALSENAAKLSNAKIKNSWEITQKENEERTNLHKNIAETLQAFSPILQDAHKSWIESEQQKGEDILARRNVDLLKLGELTSTQRESQLRYNAILQSGNEIVEEERAAALAELEDISKDVSEFRIQAAERLRHDLAGAGDWTLARYYRDKLRNFSTTVSDDVANWMATNTEPVTVGGQVFTPKALTTSPNWPPELHEAAWNIGLEQVMRKAGLDRFSPELLAYHGVTATPGSATSEEKLGAVEQARNKYLAQITQEYLTTQGNNAQEISINDLESGLDEITETTDLATDDVAASKLGVTIETFWQSSAQWKDENGFPLTSNKARWEHLIKNLAPYALDNESFIDQFGEIILPLNMVPDGAKTCEDGKYRIKCIWPEGTSGNKIAALEAAVGDLAQERVEAIEERKTEQISLAQANYYNDKSADYLNLDVLRGAIIEAGKNPSDLDWFKEIEATHDRDYAVDKAWVESKKNETTGLYEILPGDLNRLNPRIQEEFAEEALKYEDSLVTQDDGGVGEEAWTEIETTFREILDLTDTTKYASNEFRWSTEAAWDAYERKFWEYYRIDGNKDNASRLALQDIRKDLQKGDGSQYMITGEDKEAEAASLRIELAAKSKVLDLTRKWMIRERDAQSLTDETLHKFLFDSDYTTTVIPGTESLLKDAIAAINDNKQIPEHVLDFYRALSISSTYYGPYQAVRAQIQAYENNKGDEENNEEQSPPLEIGNKPETKPEEEGGKLTSLYTGITYAGIVQQEWPELASLNRSMFSRQSPQLTSIAGYTMKDILGRYSEVPDESIWKQPETTLPWVSSFWSYEE